MNNIKVLYFNEDFEPNFEGIGTPATLSDVEDYTCFSGDVPTTEHFRVIEGVYKWFYNALWDLTTSWFDDVEEKICGYEKVEESLLN